MLRTSILAAFKLFTVMTIITGIAYPLIVYSGGILFFPKESRGSLVYKDSIPIGSRLIAQPGGGPGYFQPRPSAGAYSTVPSEASNLALSSVALRDSMQHRAGYWGETVGKTPPDLLFSSGSGLDPHISVEAALFQLDRIARARHLSGEKIIELKRIIARRTEEPQLGFLGASRVNVLLLNCDIEGIKVE